MKTERNILIAFILNLGFSIFEFIGGTLTNSISITSDAIHDMGDALSIGASYFLERKSKKEADAKHSYGYARYSLVGSAITISVLVFGSLLMITEAIKRIQEPAAVDYNSMIWLAIFGLVVNSIAAIVTHGGHSHNQKAVNLHMFEDVFGWIVVLIGAIVMNFTDFTIIDSAMSIGIAVYILISAIRQFREIIDIMLNNTPSGFAIDEIEDELKLQHKDIKDVHHMHIWSTDGIANYATLHVVVSDDANIVSVKRAVKDFMTKQEIIHTTIEIELASENCNEEKCKTPRKNKHKHDHEHHNHKH